MCCLQGVALTGQANHSTIGIMRLENERWTRRNGATNEVCVALSRSLDVPVSISRLLLNRGIDEDSIDNYLHPSTQHLHQPDSMAGMEEAVACFLEAVAKKQRILIYGDYDADGVTATSVLLRFLRRMRYPSYYYIPHRQTEGYGLHEPAIRKAHEKGIGLIVTCDCGTSSFNEVRYAHSLGMNVIVTDHHQVEQPIPDGLIVINPHRPDCTYPFKHLSGVGVAFKFCQALAPHVGISPRELQADLDLVAIGTLADMVELRGENRALVRLGLDMIPSKTTSPGIRALIGATGLGAKPIGEREIGYMLAPRLNACGRLSLAKTAVKLLLTQSKEEARKLAQQLNRENSRRQTLQKQMRREADALVTGKMEPVLLVAQEGWHPGIIGLVASHLKEKYHRPAMAISVNGAVARGSARSIPGFPIFQALTECQDLLVDFGGHRLAAGFTVPTGRIEELRSRLIGIAQNKLTADDYVNEVLFDGELAFTELSSEYIEQLQMLAPFGAGNPEPVFLARYIRVDKMQRVGNSFRLTLCEVGARNFFQGFMFDRQMNGDSERNVVPGDVVSMLYTPTMRTWQGAARVQLSIHSIKRDVVFADSQERGGVNEC